MTERPTASLNTWAVVLIGPHGDVIARLSPNFDRREEARAARGVVRSERGDRKWIQIARYEVGCVIEFDSEEETP